MRTFVLILGLAGLAFVPAVSFGQCRGGGGGTGTTAAASSRTVGGNVSGTGSTLASGQLLTGPGSWHYDVMMQQQLEQTMAQQQYAIAMEQAAKAQAKFEQRLANAQKRRTEAAYKLEIDRARRSTALAKQ